MSVGENSFPNMPTIGGCRISAVAAGIRYQNRPDLVLIELAEGALTAGCFTQNTFQAAPVIVAKEHIQQASPRYFLINSGNANACTGEAGLRDARASCIAVGKLGSVETSEVLPYSTGVIGELMNMEALHSKLPESFASLSEDGWKSGAQGIMTTDTFPKGVTRTITVEGIEVSINGIAKGAGMIRPDMATMLAYVVSDAAVTQSALEQLCQRAVDKSFNRITVDGDTSTNDAAMLACTNCAGNDPIDDLESETGKLFSAAVFDVFQELAQLLVRDGEGATKFVTVQVESAASEADALAVAYAVAESPLVKTALFASDPNWGRIVMAIGKAGVRGLVAQDVKVWLGDVLVAEDGAVASTYTESLGQGVLNQEEFTLRVNLGMGSFSESVWTCDLSHEYVTINADYRS